MTELENSSSIPTTPTYLQFHPGRIKVEFEFVSWEVEQWAVHSASPTQINIYTAINPDATQIHMNHSGAMWFCTGVLDYSRINVSVPSQFLMDAVLSVHNSLNSSLFIENLTLRTSKRSVTSTLIPKDTYNRDKPSVYADDEQIRLSWVNGAILFSYPTALEITTQLAAHITAVDDIIYAMALESLKTFQDFSPCC